MKQKTKKKSKLAIIVSNSLYVRNYIHSKQLKKVEKTFNVTLIVNSKISERFIKEKKCRCFETYSFSKIEEQRERLLDEAGLFFYKHRSKTFGLRAARLFTASKKNDYERKFSLSNIRRFIFWIKSMLFAQSWIYFPYYFFWRNFTPINKSIFRAIDKHKPEIVLLPSSSSEPERFSVLKTCKMLKIPSFLIVDNWDNLSSKTVLTEKPNFIGVWGKQTALHAEKIQKINRMQIKVLGTPRYEVYFRKRNSKINSKFNFPYILFLGTALDWDELGALKKIDSILNCNTVLYKNTKVVYRPHPWRQGLGILNENHFSKILIDPQVKNEYLKEKRSTSFQPDLDYYPSLVQNAIFVVGGLSSMLIEATIMYKNFLALVYDDKINILTNQKNVFKNYTHFKEIKKLPNLYFCKNLSDLDKEFKDLFKSSVFKNKNKKKIDKARSFFLFRGKEPYSSLLDKSCVEIISRCKNHPIILNKV